MPMSRRIRVLIVDDSAFVRKVLSMGLSDDPRFDVVAAVSNTRSALEAIRIYKPDVMTLDLEMPYEDGLTFLRTHGATLAVPTVVISAHTGSGARNSLDALDAGAVDVLLKPSEALSISNKAAMGEIRERVYAAADARVPARLRQKAPRRIEPLEIPPEQPRQNRFAERIGAPGHGDWVFAIGASTGGVQALSSILPMFPENSPGIVIVQHMPSGFTEPFAKRLNSACAIEVREARDGDVLRPGLALLAPGGTQHMTLIRAASAYCVALNEGQPVCFSRPSVDVLFHSVARATRGRSSAALLTGMGRDGAEGMLAIRQAGGSTLAQDADTSVVNGMPQAAADRNACQRRVPLMRVPDAMMQTVGTTHRGTKGTPQ